MIYFLRSSAGPIKIGTTIRLTQRLRQLAAEHGEGLEVLAVLDGSRDVEQALHGRFAHLRRVGEWFEPGDDLLGFIVSDGRPWDGSDEVAAPDIATIRVEAYVNDLIREAAAITRESVVAYSTRVLRERAEADILTNAKRRIQELEKGMGGEGDA